jgi:tetratricopeptide (TPR) repeat protein
VESVAWVAERKDVLSTFFWMLTTWAYIHYVEHPRLRNYLAVLALFALGLMAKPMLVTLPFVLLLLDYWPLQRLQGAGSMEQAARSESQNTDLKREPLSADKRKRKSAKKRVAQAAPPSPIPPLLSGTGPCLFASSRLRVKKLLLEKIPFFAIAALSSIVTFIAQQKGGAVETIEALTPGVRIANAFVSYIKYIEKTLWPANLAVYYPHPGLPPLWQVMGAAVLLGAVTFTVIRTAKRFPYLAMGWLWYAGTLVPVIGIVQVGTQAMADRYAYIPLIGLFVMAAWGIPELLEKWRYRNEALVASAALVFSSLLIVTWTQVGYWRNAIALFDHALEVTGHNYTALNNRGVAYGKLGDYRRAISDYDSAVEINPKYAYAYNNRGMAYAKLGDYRRAISDYDRTIEIDPNFEDAYSNRGAAYVKLGNHRQAISDYDRAIEIDPKCADAYYNRGVAYGELGNQKQAISDYGRAIEINPKYADAYSNRGVAYNELGNHRQAISDYDRAIEINPEHAELYYNRGLAYGELGDHRQAISDYDRAIGINPKYAEAYSNRGAVYGILGNYRQAISDYDRTVEIDPEHAEAYYNRGLAYGRLGDHRLAIEDYDRAIEINPKYADAYSNRGAVYGMLGNYRHAIEDYDRAIEINPEHARAYNNRGLAYGRLGNDRQAVEDYNRAIEIDPGYAKAYYNQAVAYGKLGNRMQEIEDLKRAAGLGDEDAGKALRSMGINR